MLIYAHNVFQNTLDKYVVLEIYSQGKKNSAISSHSRNKNETHHRYSCVEVEIVLLWTWLCWGWDCYWAKAMKWSTTLTNRRNGRGCKMRWLLIISCCPRNLVRMCSYFHWKMCTYFILRHILTVRFIEKQWLLWTFQMYFLCVACHFCKKKRL